MGAERAVAAIEHSLAQSYTGIYEPNAPRPGRAPNPFAPIDDRQVAVS